MKLREGGYSGKLYPINPKAKEIAGLKVYPNLSTLPEVPDLAIVCVAASRISSSERRSINDRQPHKIP